MCIFVTDCRCQNAYLNESLGHSIASNIFCTYLKLENLLYTLISFSKKKKGGLSLLSKIFKKRYYGTKSFLQNEAEFGPHFLTVGNLSPFYEASITE